MQIKIEKSLVEFCPEGAEEKAKLELIWRMMVDCVGENKRMVPVGGFVPEKNNKGATFLIENLEESKQRYTEIHVEKDCRCYCTTCNKFIDLKKGDPIPLCCGKIMEIID